MVWLARKGCLVLTARMVLMVLRAVQVLTVLMVCLVGMVRPVSAVMWALQVLPARKARRVNGVSVAPPVRTDPMVKMVGMALMGVRWCLCTVPGAALL